MMAEPDEVREPVAAPAAEATTPSRERPAAPRRLLDRPDRRPSGWCRGGRRRRLVGLRAWADQAGPGAPRHHGGGHAHRRERHRHPRRQARRAGREPGRQARGARHQRRRPGQRAGQHQIGAAAGRRHHRRPWARSLPAPRAPPPTSAAKLEQADRAFRAAGDQVTARLEAVNAKLVEVEQGQPADIVDKKTVSDIAAKQGSIEQGQQSVAAALARLEQLVTQSLEAGNKQAAALQTMVEGARSRMEEIAAQQRDLLAMKNELGRSGQGQPGAGGRAQRHRSAAPGDPRRAAGQGPGRAHRAAAAAGGHQHAPDDAKVPRASAASACPSPPTAWTPSLQNGQPFVPTIDTLRQLAQGDPVVQERRRHAGADGGSRRPDLGEPGAAAGRDRAEPGARLRRAAVRLARAHAART